ncbi:MAG: hypothetical protein WBR24_07075 [Desulfobacterales bacterium]
MIIRTIDGLVAFVKHNGLWVLIDSMIRMRNTRAVVVIFILSCVVCQTMVVHLYAQDGDFFFIQRPKLGLEGYCRLREEERKTPNYKLKTTDQKFVESMTIETNGWIYHPNLMEFYLALEPEAQQETFQQTESVLNQTQTYRKNIPVLAFDVGATFFKQKPLSLDIFANRTKAQIDFSNAHDADIDSEKYGTRLNFNNPTLPVSLSLIHNKLDQTGFYESEAERNVGQLTIGHNAKKSVTNLNMIYLDSETTRTTFETLDFSTKTLSTELTNAYFVTDDNRVRLDSRIYNLQADYNGLDQDTWIVSENLYWPFSDTLLTRYRADYNHNDFGGIVSQEAGFSAGLTHLFDHLTTDLDAAAVMNRFDGGSLELYKTNAGFFYHRPIPWGSVELNAAFDYGLTNRSGTSRIIPRQEQLVLPTGTETFLDKENVDLASIVVTDITGSTVYTENIDYRVEMVGDAVNISRTMLGAIADGQQVIVNYTYQINTGYDDSRFGQKYGFSLTLWSFLYLTYSHGRIDQHILSGEPPNNPLHDTSNTVRLGLVKGWSDTEFLYDNRDRSNGNSCVTRSITERINLRPARNLFLNFTGSIGDRSFPDLNEKEKFYSVGTSMGWTPKPWCNFSLIGVYNDISGDRRDESTTEIGSTVKLIYGIWTGSVGYSLRDQQDQQYGNSLWRQQIIFRLTRHLW